MELNKIYQGNAYDLIKQVPSKSIDLIITDPPYEMASGGTGKTELAIRFKDRYKELKDKKLDVGLDFSILPEMERVCRYIYIYIWCNKVLLFKLINYYSQREDILLDLITWGKTNPMPLSNNHFLNDTEYCLCIHEKGKKWNSKVGASVKRKCYMTQVNKTDRKDYDFPCCKPTPIIENFIINSSNEGDIIFDPFCGSGSTLISAKRLKRKYLGFELDKKTFDMASKRLKGENAKGELNLFDIDYD